MIPRPIGWISSLSADGVANLAPYSYFNAVAHDQPHVMFSSIGLKDTLRNIRQTQEFVCNIVTMEVIEKMNFTATNFPGEEDEFGWAGLTPGPSRLVRPSRVVQAKAHLECRCREIVAAGNGQIVIGEVVHIHVQASAWEAGRVSPRRLDPVCRLSGSGYARLGDIYRLPRETWRSSETGRGDAQAGPSMPRLARSDSGEVETVE